MLKRNLTKEKLKAGQVAIGFRMDYSSPDIIEILGNVGFDFLYYDCEHATMNEEACQYMIRTAELVGLTPIVRIPANQPQYILRALDSGAMGIIVPHCNTREEAQSAVKAAKYPPEGERGIAGRSIRMSGMGPADYVIEANKETMVIAMVEEAQALENFSEILSVDGLDVVWIGRADLALSLGIPGQLTHPKVQEAVKKAIAEARVEGKIIGVGAMPAENPETVAQFASQGAQFFSLNTANLFKIAAVEWLKKARGNQSGG